MSSQTNRSIFTRIHCSPPHHVSSWNTPLHLSSARSDYSFLPSANGTLRHIATAERTDWFHATLSSSCLIGSWFLFPCYHALCPMGLSVCGPRGCASLAQEMKVKQFQATSRDLVQHQPTGHSSEYGDTRYQESEYWDTSKKHRRRMSRFRLDRQIRGSARAAAHAPSLPQSLEARSIAASARHCTNVSCDVPRILESHSGGKKAAGIMCFDQVSTTSCFALCSPTLLVSSLSSLQPDSLGHEVPGTITSSRAGVQRPWSLGSCKSGKLQS